MNCKDIKYNIGDIIACSTSEGPFKRLVVFFQGCDIRCEGCYNKQYWNLDTDKFMTLYNLIRIIKSSIKENGIEGVTLLGGEPTLQKNLSILLKEIHQLGIGVIMFTGRKFEDLNNELLEYLDVVVDGRYEKDNEDTKRSLIGSYNQKVYILTERYWNIEDYYLELGENYEISTSVNKIKINGSKF